MRRAEGWVWRGFVLATVLCVLVLALQVAGLAVAAVSDGLFGGAP